MKTCERFPVNILQKNKVATLSPVALIQVAISLCNEQHLSELETARYIADQLWMYMDFNSFIIACDNLNSDVSVKFHEGLVFKKN